jgi:hypothetical protein
VGLVCQSLEGGRWWDAPDKDRTGSHQPPVVLAKQHAVGRRKADIDRVAFAEDMGIDDCVGLEPQPLGLDGMESGVKNLEGCLGARKF